ncbi:NADH-quinone oxidoreductase subunit L [Buchnera aphidicola]|nr:NADH-quinone oxidoreductase subunit L [Buchnera aphidicola]
MIYLIVLFPIISFIFLFFFKNILSYKLTILFGISSIFLSTIVVILLRILFLYHHNDIIEIILWNWWNFQDFNINICFLLDNLTFLFLNMITIISCLVCLFSIWYMKNKFDNASFFALINLFVGSMIILVLSNNFVLMYLGWEGISICSYLLINFYFSKSDVNISAFKAFIFTKIGDLFLIAGIILLYIHYHTLNFYDIQFLIKIHIIKYTFLLNIINILLLFGVIGKSAQIPLHIWLPEAMVGPTPVSALIHAATMVTAGVYLITRNYNLFTLTPNILYMIGIIGSITLILSSFLALIKTDIKQILAYSTIGQIGYIFIALSIGAWNSAIIHLTIHAFFKALLFLSAGILIVNCNNEKNIFYMGNQLYKKFPFLYFCFLIGGFSLSGFPILTAGFYSKDSILFYIYQSHNILFFMIAILSILLTTLYIFRLIFIVFHSKSNKNILYSSLNFLQYIPLSILSLLSTIIGIYIIPDISNIFPKIIINQNYIKLYLEIISSILVFLGIFISYYLNILNTDLLSKINLLKIVYFPIKIVNDGFGFFYFYNLIFINLYLKIADFLSLKLFKKINIFLLFLIKKINLFFLYTENSLINLQIFIIIFSVFILIMMINFY